jgi:hypothetical protein
MLAFGVAWPMPWRIFAVGIVCVLSVRELLPYVLLRGAHAVHSIEWTAQSPVTGFTLRIGPRRLPVRATLARSSFRLGRSLLSLAFATADGPHRVFIDGGLHDPRAFRRLCREFSRKRGPRSGQRSVAN